MSHPFFIKGFIRNPEDQLLLEKELKAEDLSIALDDTIKFAYDRLVFLEHNLWI